MSNELLIKKLILDINKRKKSGAFRNYIEYIRFPFYKNLEQNAEIKFEFPFTILTGQNGSGKSSALHAIQGAPSGESPTKFWFSTQVDPIIEGDGHRNCFIYGYYIEEENSIQEVIKTRISDLKYSKELDLWETSRPILEYGMQKNPQNKRTPPIKKPVRFLDFRAELSAFDKYFYFADFNKTKTVQTKQDYVRKYSWKLKDIIDNNSIQEIRYIKRNEKPISLKPEEINAINKILGKNYTNCKLIKHSLFKNTGLTIFFETETGNYSEAFAGRGEYAVVKLVHEIIEAPENSLIVLDEPEVSLHPGAQEELKIFLLQEVLKKGLQIVISTHSIKMVEYLPSDAIKLFYKGQSEKFKIKNNTHAIEAFHFIGHQSKDKKIIIVEDRLAKMLLDKIILEMGGENALIFEVVYHPGGASEIMRRAVTYSEEKETNKFLLLDGDQKKTITKINPEELSVSDTSQMNKIEKVIRQASNIEFNKLGFRLDGTDAQKIIVANNYLKFLWSNLDFFPGYENPETLIWNSEFADKLLRVQNIEQTFDNDSKTNFYEFSKKYYDDATENSIISSHKLFIKEFCNQKNGDYKSICETIETFKK